MFEVEVLFLGIVVPFLFSAVVALFLPSSWPGSLRGTLALLAGLVATYLAFGLKSWVSFLPEDGWEYIFVLMGAALVLEGGALGLGLPSAVVWISRLVIACLAGWLSVPGYGALHDWRFLCASLIALAVLALGTSLHRFARERPGVGFPLLLSATLFLASIVIAEAGFNKLAQVGAAVAFGLAGLAAVSWKSRSALPAGAMPAIAVALPVLAFSGFANDYSELPVWCFVILGTAPLLLWLEKLPPGSLLSGWSRQLYDWVVVLVPVGSAVAVVVGR
ncbi:hypothetical protein Pan216_14190 [Planctomycetes bacterium Pan216]|uniref:Uncharacterized protein n=1 Tax=Kolteria novifilia TaxID=2527975 RepID=A0A518B0Q8_9BACT|nr:hypothetical protein Pan216_14190 [Planctomycetes bacterium Pan216]